MKHEPPVSKAALRSRRRRLRDLDRERTSLVNWLTVRYEEDYDLPTNAAAALARRELRA